MTFATQGSAQTKVSTLDEIEKAAVLYGFCNKIYRQKYAEDETGISLGEKFNFNNLRVVVVLVKDILENNKDNYPRGKTIGGHLVDIEIDAEMDLTKRLLLDEFTLTQELIDNCISDGKRVVSEQYIDHFDYMN